jgi:hypothetical protein
MLSAAAANGPFLINYLVLSAREAGKAKDYRLTAAFRAMSVPLGQLRCSTILRGGDSDGLSTEMKKVRAASAAIGLFLRKRAKSSL